MTRQITVPTMSAAHFTPFLPTQINTGPWLAGYTLDALRERAPTHRMVLPVCSLGTPPEELAALARLVLPPLYHEALDADLKDALIRQIRRCFPFFEGTQSRRDFRGTFEVVELPIRPPARVVAPPKVLAFGVDTTVEQHGPHLPLATDTIQTYAVLQRLASGIPGFAVGPAIEYGQLTWGLPFGFSVDITAALVTRYMRGFVNALLDWLAPAAVYVADVHGSLVHRTAMQDGLRQSRCTRWAFRWLHDPLTEFGSERGDMHAGGVETTLIHHINPALIDARWWPARTDQLAAAQMTTPEVVELSSDLPRFIERVETRRPNGIIGDIRNAAQLDANLLFNRMLDIARADVGTLVDH